MREALQVPAQRERLEATWREEVIPLFAAEGQEELALRYLDSYSKAIAFIASHSDASQAPQQSDGISIKLSALHPRYEDAQSERVLAEWTKRYDGKSAPKAK